MKRFKYFGLSVLVLFLLSGCGNMGNTPTKKVEAFLNKYQTQDKTILAQLDDVIEQSGNFIDNQKEEYRNLMKKQYQNLSYKIKNDTIDGNNATVEVEVEVYDYGKAISESENYLQDYRDEFLDSDGLAIDTIKFLDYKINQMKGTNDKVKYTINFNLTKVDNEWKLEDISDIDRQKLHGLYY